MLIRFRNLAPIILACAFAALPPQSAFADDIGCVTTAGSVALFFAERGQASGGRN